MSKYPYICGSKIYKSLIMIGFNYRKAIQILTFFAHKEGGIINKMKAYKLIWLSDRSHLRNFGRTILNDTYFALKNGPIPSNTKDIVENYDLPENEQQHRDIFLEIVGKYDFKAKNEIDKAVFSETDLSVMEDIYKNFGDKTPFQLSDISHFYPEWKKFENSLENANASRFEMNYNDFFENPTQNNHQIFTENPEILALTKDIFAENTIIENLI